MDIKTATEEFERHLMVSRSEATARTYGTALTHLVNWAIIEGVDEVADVNPGRFFAHLKEVRGVSATTMAGYMTAMSRFYSYLNTEQIVSDAQYATFKRRLANLRGRAASRKLPEIPTEQTFQTVLAQARVENGGTPRQGLMRLRNIALLETLRATGCRVAEVVNMQVRDLGETSARITGKGDKMRIVYFDSQSWEAVQTYLESRSALPDEPVFARHDRRVKGIHAMSVTSVRYVIDGLAKAAGIDPKTISPHKFRHRFASKVLAGTQNLAVTQDLMGHSNPATTRVYARLTNGQLSAAHNGVAL